MVSTADAAVRSVGQKWCHYSSIFGNVCCLKGQIKKHRNPHTAGGGGEGGHPQTLTSILLNAAVLPERGERDDRARERKVKRCPFFLGTLTFTGFNIYKKTHYFRFLWCQFNKIN